jgi:DNA-binding transcriptional MerR regulator
MAVQSNKLYYTISEVAELTGVATHVLRYWEKEFRLLAPRRSSAGVRLYQLKDIHILREIAELLHEKKFTIQGAKLELKNRKEHSEIKKKEQVVASVEVLSTPVQTVSLTEIAGIDSETTKQIQHLQEENRILRATIFELRMQLRELLDNS